MEFYVRLVAESGQLNAGRVLVDLGCGLSLFGLLCRVFGMEVSLVDDFGGGGGIQTGSAAENVPLLVWMKQSQIGRAHV